MNFVFRGLVGFLIIWIITWVAPLVTMKDRELFIGILIGGAIIIFMELMILSLFGIGW